VLFVDSDDILQRSGVEALLRALVDHDADVAAGSWCDFDATKRERVTNQPTPIYSDPYANFVHCRWVTGSIMHRNNRATRFNPCRMPWEGHEFYLDYLTPGARAVYVNSIVVYVRQHSASSRLTHAHDHFEPFRTGLFFAEKKKDLREGRATNLEREEALDARIVSCIHMLLGANRITEARNLFERVSWEASGGYRWVRPGSFAWCCRQFGFHMGARGFIAANRVIGRA
jgi:hypothetical protein